MVTTETHVDKASAWDELTKKNAEIERLRTALAEMTVEFVASHKEGHISTMPKTAQRIIRNAEALLARETAPVKEGSS